MHVSNPDVIKYTHRIQTNKKNRKHEQKKETQEAKAKKQTLQSLSPKFGVGFLVWGKLLFSIRETPVYQRFFDVGAPRRWASFSPDTTVVKKNNITSTKTYFLTRNEMAKCEACAFSRGRWCGRDELPVLHALKGSLTADRAEQCSFLDLARRCY